MKTLLILTDEHEHSRYSQAASVIAQHLEAQNMRVVMIDAANIGNKMHRLSGGTIVFRPRMLWKLVYTWVSKHPTLVSNLVTKLITRNFLQLLQREDPDIILSINCGFTGSILDLLHKYNIMIPFMTFIDDLVSLTNTKADKRANYVLVTTDEAEQICNIYGYSSRKIKNFGYPTGTHFTNNGDSEQICKNPGVTTYFIASSNDDIRGELRIVIKKLILNGNCKIKIVVPKTNYQKTKKLFGSEKVLEIYHDEDNIEDIMQTCDVAIIREYPSTIMECIACAIPIILVGATDSAKGNMYFLTNNSLGLTCSHGKDILHYVNKLYRDNAKLYKSIKKNQIYYNLRYGNAAEKIAKFISDFATHRVAKVNNKSKILCAENFSSLL